MFRQFIGCLHHGISLVIPIRVAPIYISPLVSIPRLPWETIPIIALTVLPRTASPMGFMPAKSTNRRHNRNIFIPHYRIKTPGTAGNGGTDYLWKTDGKQPQGGGAYYGILQTAHTNPPSISPFRYSFITVFDILSVIAKMAPLLSKP